ncbi:MAG: zinc transporter ZupT, partial [Mucinivorans sp.]
MEYAIILTLIAGLSTGIGSLIALLAKRTNRKFLSFSLGLSAGVMIYVSFIDIFPTANVMLSEAYGSQMGAAATAAAFFGGILLIAIIDRFVPSIDNPHEMSNVESMDEADSAHKIKQKKLMRMGLMTALVIGIHNFPEGMAT